MNNYKIKYDRISFQNRWRIKRYSRSSDWVILGIQEHWVHYDSFCYKICFFGFDIHIWLKRIFI